MGLTYSTARRTSPWDGCAKIRSRASPSGRLLTRPPCSAQTPSSTLSADRQLRPERRDGVCRPPTVDRGRGRGGGGGRVDRLEDSGDGCRNPRTPREGRDGTVTPIIALVPNSPCRDLFVHALMEVVEQSASPRVQGGEGRHQIDGGCVRAAACRLGEGRAPICQEGSDLGHGGAIAVQE